jgi:hypothetical protein
MSEEKFRRYTTLPFLLDALYHRRLPLLDPTKWDDKNDSYFIEQYKKKKKDLKTVLATCFTYSEEKYHHWKIYAGDSSGMCIEFNHPQFLERLKTENKFRVRHVDYYFIDSLERDVPTIDKLPFIKRYPFSDEHEFRVIYENSDKEIPIEYIPITPSDIQHIIINPWVNKSVSESVRSVIRSIKGFSQTQVFQSTVLENEKWKKIGRQASVPKQAQLFGLIKDEVEVEDNHEP